MLLSEMDSDRPDVCDPCAPLSSTALGGFRAAELGWIRIYQSHVLLHSRYCSLAEHLRSMSRYALFTVVS
jgi:hypothetical protein